MAVLMSLFTLILVTKNGFTIAGQDQRPILHSLLEKALTDNSSNLFQLQRIYFHPTEKHRGDIQLLATVTVANISTTSTNSNCPAFKYTCDQTSHYCNGSSRFKFTLSQYSKEDDGALQLSNVVGRDGSDTLLMLDPSFSFLTGSTAIPQWLNRLFVHQSDDSLELYLQINELESMPDYGEVRDALSMVLVWAKAYARSSGSEKENSDRSIVEINFDDGNNLTLWCQERWSPYWYRSLTASITLNLILGIVLLANILLFMLTLRYFHVVFNWFFQNERAKNFYQASAIVLILLNLGSFVFDLILISIEFQPNYYLSNINSTAIKAALVFKLSSTVVMPVLEFMWIGFSIYHSCHPQKGNCKIFLHSTGFCQIFWFAHRLLIDFIISIVFFIIAPAQTVGIMTLLLFTIFSAIIFIAQLLNIKYRCDKKTLLSLICISITGTVTVALVLMITLLFIMLVDNGLKSAGMGGFIVSIIPPLVALIIGLYVNRETLDNFLKWTKPTNSELNSTGNRVTIQTDDNIESDTRLPVLTDGNNSDDERTHLSHTFF